PDAPNSDSGRSQFDNVTNVNTPRIYLRLNDAFYLNDLPGNGVPNNPPAGVIPIPYSTVGQSGFAIGIFNGDAPDVPIGFALPVTGRPGVYFFDFTTPLVDGLHHLVARVQMIDPAFPGHETGFGDHSLSLDFIVDTAVPPVRFGTPDAGPTS